MFLALAAAGLLRPDAWVLSGAYWLWCSWPRKAERGAGAAGRELALRSLRYLALAAIAPVLWAALDWIVTGNPLYSLTATAGLAAELERTQGFASVLGSVWTYGVRIDKLPVLLGGLLGAGLALWMAPRRALVPLATFALLTGVYVAEGAVGASVVDRYLLGAAVALLPFCAVTIGGWTMLEPGSWLRRAWILGCARARRIRWSFGGQHAQPLEPAPDARRARGLPRGARRRAAQPGRRAPSCGAARWSRCPTTS